jgi:hypothetical protein
LHELAKILSNLNDSYILSMSMIHVVRAFPQYTYKRDREREKEKEREIESF